MAENTTRNYLIGFVIFTAFILSAISLINIIRVDVPDAVSQSELQAFNSTFNKYDDLNSGALGLKNTTKFPTLSEIGATVWKAGETTGALLAMGVNGINFIIDGFQFVIDAINGLPTIIPGFPTWASGLIALTIIIIFSLVLIEASLNRSV